MNAKTAITTAIVSGASLLFVALINKLRLKDERDTISKDIAIYKMLPSKSSVRNALLKRIDENIANSLTSNRSVRRDIPGTTAKFFGALLGLSLVWYISNNSAMLFDWKFWLSNPIYLILELISVVAAVYIIIDIASSLEKRLRDENGKPIKESHNYEHTLLSMNFGKILLAFVLVPALAAALLITAVRHNLDHQEEPPHNEPPHFSLQEYIKAPYDYIKGLLHHRYFAGSVNFSTKFQPTLIKSPRFKK
jgi:hypothetical protein